MSNDINVITIFSAEAIAGSGNSLSEPIPMDAYKPNGFMGLQVTSAGASSVVKLEYLVSNDGTTYVEPDGAVDIVTALSPGNAYYSFSPPAAKYMKIKATETAGNNVTSLTAILALQ